MFEVLIRALTLSEDKILELEGDEVIKDTLKSIN